MKKCKVYRDEGAYCSGLIFVDTDIYDEYANDGESCFLGIFEFEKEFLDKLQKKTDGVWDESMCE